MAVFEVSEGVVVKLNGETIAEVEELTVEVLKGIAKKAGIKKFTAELGSIELTADDFPVTEGEVVIKPYYEAK